MGDLPPDDPISSMHGEELGLILPQVRTNLHPRRHA